MGTMGKTKKDKTSYYLNASKVERDRTRPRSAIIEDEVRKAERRSNKNHRIALEVEDAYLELEAELGDYGELEDE